jgi:hypothetical protein
MDFRRATITEADLQDIVFGKDINFSDTRFGVAVDAARAHQQGSQTAGPGAPPAGQPKCPQVAPAVATVFRFVTFEGHAYFLRTAFCGRTSLEQVIFHKDVNFTDATFQDHQVSGRPGFSLSYVNFTTLRLKWSQLAYPASWVQDSNTYEERIQGFLEREAREVQAKRKAQSRNRKNTQEIEAERKLLEPLSDVLKSLEANFRRQNELDDANEAYYQMKRAELREAREHPSLWQRLSHEIEWLLYGIFSRYGTGFWTVVFWTLGFNMLFTLIYTTVSGRIGKCDLRWIVRVEWVLGFILLAFLIYTLTNTQPLLYKLIHGVF